MEKEKYLRGIADYFAGCRVEDFDAKTLHEVGRCLLDHLGCAAFAAGYGLCGALVRQIMSLVPESPEHVSVWGEERTTSAWAAAFANATRTSNIELDDCSGIGASVHPGVYIWSSVLAQAEVLDCSGEDVIRAAVFGYDLCMRLGLLATGQMRRFGLHGPGFVGGLGVAGASALLRGLDGEGIENALCIAASLLPVCPFTSFMEGADSKDLYGGWGVALGIFAAQAAAAGLTGPKHILEGEKSLREFFAGEKGLDVEPGSHFYINDISFKQFSACHSVHPAVTAVKRLLARTDFRPEDIESVVVSTYPYSYALNEGVTDPLTPSSARLCLPYTVAVALLEGDLPPTAFYAEHLGDPRVAALRSRISVTCNEAYGDGPFGVRGCGIDITLKDGSRLSEETTSCEWDNAPSDEALAGKFRALAQDSLGAEACARLERLCLNFGPESRVKDITNIMNRLSARGAQCLTAANL